MTNPQHDILMSMNLLRSGVQGKSKEFKQAVGTYHARRKVWQIRAINYTILIGVMALVGLTIYSVI
tara:strand:- start:764 stop:961 length:198 start_codon:yes stop_codon:yes gene_type:complete